ELQSIRLRVLGEDESIRVARAAERAAKEARRASIGIGAAVGGRGRGGAPGRAGPALEVAAVEVVAADEGDGLEEDAGAPAADWL
ncbi:MAG: hypothetical protein C4343_06975, partial [Chloroflexota bacterium]